MRNRPILRRLTAVAAVTIAVGTSCGGADPVSPRVWAARNCDAEAQALQTFTESMRSAQSLEASTPFEERLASGRAYLGALSDYGDAYVEALIAIGPPEVSGGPGWYDDYVESARRNSENTKFVGEQYLDEMGGLPSTREPSRAEKALGARTSELLKVIDEETDEVEQAKPSVLSSYEGQCDPDASNNNSGYTGPGLEELFGN